MTEGPPSTKLSWLEIDTLLQQALELAGPERADFLQGLSPSIRKQLEQALTGQAADAVDALIRASLDSALDGASTGPTPHSIGPWRLIRELGAGGMAQVFEARREEADFEQRAAVKILWPFRAGDVFQERFVQERRILAGLSHPGIAGLLDGGMLADRRPWFAMEYVEGVKIDEHCRGLSLRERLAVFLQVCEAVEFAHGQLVVHRDIKPANILVDESGRVRLLDFGIAKLVDAADDAPLTRTGGSLLTLQYASPEQVTQAPLTVATDIYQLGMLLYQLLAERLPYALESQSLKQAIETICSVRPPPPSRYNDKVGSDLDAIVLFALRKDPAHRYRSVSALARDLRQYLEGRPVAARPRSQWYVLRRFVRRHALLVGATVLVIAALTTASLVSISLARRANLEAARSATALQVLTSVFEQADPFERPGPDMTLGEALVERFDTIAERVDHDPVLATRVFLQLGGIFSQLGMHEHAERAYRQALDAAGASIAVPPGDRLAATAGIAVALNAQGRFQETLAFIDGLRLAPPASAEEARAHIRILLEQAEALLPSEDFEAAARHLENVQALVARYGIDDPGLLFGLHNTLASTARIAEDFDAAELHTRRAVAYAGEVGERGAEATLLQNLAIDLGRQGRFDEAEPYFLEAMAIVDEQAPGHPSKLEYAVNYAGWLYRVGRFDEAVALLRDTLAALTGTPDRHLWAYANRDLATYAFATGDMDASLQANREYLLAAPELYGADSPAAAFATILFARHLSLAGLHESALSVMQRALSAQPTIGGTSLAPFLAELRLDAGDFEAAMQGYDPGADPQDPNAVLLDLKFNCAKGDYAALAARLESGHPAAATDSHLDRRLRAWQALMAAALARRAHAEPEVHLAAAFEILASTPRLTTLEEWRMLRELMPLYESLGPVPAALSSAWDALARQRVLTRELLLDDYLPDGAALGLGLNRNDQPREPAPLPCLR